MRHIATILCFASFACSHRPDTNARTADSSQAAMEPVSSPTSAETTSNLPSVPGPGEARHDGETPRDSSLVGADHKGNPTNNLNGSTTTPSKDDAAKTDPKDSSRPAAAQPDNTAINERDRNAQTATPLDQGNGQRDLDITQQIRKLVVGDKALSFTAKNVKIITQGGKVILRGPVNSAEERQTIDSAARKVAGANNVDNQLEVKK